jgi:hypothetical protein
MAAKRPSQRLSDPHCNNALALTDGTEQYFSPLGELDLSSDIFKRRVGTQALPASRELIRREGSFDRCARY